MVKLNVTLFSMCLCVDGQLWGDVLNAFYQSMVLELGKC